MQLTGNIIGVPGTGKSKLAREISGDNTYVLSIDLFKDGLRFVQRANPNLEFKGLPYPAKVFLEPSKNLTVDDALSAAHMRGELVEIVGKIYQERDFTGIAEGFYVPQNEAPVILLQRNYQWLSKVHAIRMKERHGQVETAKLEREVSNILHSQDMLCRLVNGNKIVETLPHYHGIRLEEDETIECTPFVNPKTTCMILFDLLGIPEQYVPEFSAGVAYGWERTKK